MGILLHVNKANELANHNQEKIKQFRQLVNILSMSLTDWYFSYALHWTERIIPTNISYLTLGYVTCLTSHHTSRLKVAKSLLKIGQALDLNNRSWVKIPSVIISRSRELIYVNHCLVYRYINMLWVLFRIDRIMSIQHNNPPGQMLHSFQVMASRRKGWSKLLTTLIFSV